LCHQGAFSCAITLKNRALSKNQKHLQIGLERP
jgi:hypothetical protein